MRRTITSPYIAALTLCAVVILGWGACPSLVSAQSGHISGPVRFDVHLGVGFNRSLGPGLRLDIPIARNGLISSVNDELALTLGVDVMFHTHGHSHGHGHGHWHRDDWNYDHHDGPNLTLLFPIALQWNFIMSNNWTIFPEMGLALQHHYLDHLDVLFDIGFGARWHFARGQTALLLRLTHPGGFQIGLAW